MDKAFSRASFLSKAQSSRVRSTLSSIPLKGRHIVPHCQELSPVVSSRFGLSTPLRRGFLLPLKKSLAKGDKMSTITYRDCITTEPQP